MCITFFTIITYKLMHISYFYYISKFVNTHDLLKYVLYVLLLASRRGGNRGLYLWLTRET